jgi:hypothetical protein
MRQKGAAIKSTLQAITNLYGEEALVTVKRLLRPEVREHIEPRVLPVAWYPIEVAAGIHVAVRDTLGKGTWDVSQKLGQEASRIDFGGSFRLFLRAMQYDTMWERAQRAWAHYNSQGEASWADRTAGRATGIITGVTGFNRGVWHAVAGRLETMLQLSGAKGATIQLYDATATGCRLDAMWLE